MRRLHALGAVAALAALAVAPVATAPGDVPDTGSLAFSPSTPRLGDTVKATANFPDGTFEITLFREAPGGEWTKVAARKSSDSGNASFETTAAAEPQNLYARITSGKKAGRTEVRTLAAAPPKTEVAVVEKENGTLTVAPKAYTRGELVTLTARLPDGKFDVTLQKETGPEVWVDVVTVRSNSSGDATFAKYPVDAQHTVRARITSGTKPGRTKPLVLTPEIVMPTGAVTGVLKASPQPFAVGASLAFVADFPKGETDVTLFRETAPDLWTKVATVESSESGDATFKNQKATDRQRLFARTKSGTRTEVLTLVASSACGGTPTVPRPGGGLWRCTFSDEFDGSSVDPLKWGIVTTKESGFRSGGECYVDGTDNVAVGDGRLDLTVRALPNKFACLSPVDGWVTRYTGGMVTTAERLEQAYGRWVVRARFVGATSTGVQSAIWLWPSTKAYGAWPRSGEIDVAEFYSRYPDRVIPFVHYEGDQADPSVTNTKCFVDRPEEFHDYAVDWTPEAITITIDGRVCVATRWESSTLPRPAPFDQPFQLNLTQALGIGQNAFVPGTTPLPASLQVDHVRVWG